MYRYKGNGEWIPDVPARDLTDEEFAAARERHPDITESPLYEHVSDREHPRLAARAEKVAEASSGAVESE